MGGVAREFGTLPFAIARAGHRDRRTGARGGTIVAQKWAAAVPELKDQPGFADTFMPRGRAPKISELVRFPDHAKTLRTLAEQGLQEFYQGEIADKIAASRSGRGRDDREGFARLQGGVGGADRSSLSWLYRP